MNLIETSDEITAKMIGAEAQEDKYRMLCREQMTWIRDYISRGNLHGKVKFIFSDKSRFQGIEALYFEKVYRRAVKEFTKANYVIVNDCEIAW